MSSDVQTAEMRRVVLLSRSEQQTHIKALLSLHHPRKREYLRDDRLRDVTAKQAALIRRTLESRIKEAWQDCLL